MRFTDLPAAERAELDAFGQTVAAEMEAGVGLEDARPIILIDFDGTVNQFPDDMTPNRHDPADWFVPDHEQRVWTDRRHGHLTLTWSGELVDRLRALDARVLWLSTWQPYTGILNQTLGVDWKTVTWYDPVTLEGLRTGKRRSVLRHLTLARPIVWIDDEETTYDAGLAIQSAPPLAPVLGIGPNAHIGISRTQMTLIERFVHQPPEEPTTTFDIHGDHHDQHWGF
ncbi:hypothetical protein [Bifidobacterium aerophilum]|uniref:Uncharacterized protein n=1 Tax=Bifidobacterium aerophilum TaxID=1798155 RepID=A0A6N9Z2R4_9BIFI|nr:hypothetical protein [Bifidobacterium aerophilum]NEG88614.1 hypothetical protein [Bifidobacterium aerophilum]